MNIEVPPDAMAVIDGECGMSGMAKREFVSRVFRWWAAQTDVVRGSILESIPSSVRVDVARLVLEKMAAEEDSAQGAGEPTETSDLGFSRRISHSTTEAAELNSEDPADGLEAGGAGSPKAANLSKGPGKAPPKPPAAPTSAAKPKG
jgi:hypothetical protein